MAMRLSMQRLPSRAVIRRPTNHVRSFSAAPSEATSDAVPDAAEWVPPPHPSHFSSPKVEELYFKLIHLPRPELKLVSKVALGRVGIDLDKENEARAAFLASGGAAQNDAAVEEAPVEVKTSFDLKLLGFDAKSKIKVIKEVRAIANLGLKEAKELVEGAPKLIRKGMKQDEAEELMKKLVEAGAEVEIV
ncbi:Ribosomal protein L7/L12 C-terminal domain [Fragilaria crotonensis]|nr:Ribosomal protein L7/L12 C-terminal domain [Fragilaria crotonensis]